MRSNLPFEPKEIRDKAEDILLEYYLTLSKGQTAQKFGISRYAVCLAFLFTEHPELVPNCWLRSIFNRYIHTLIREGDDSTLNRLFSYWQENSTTPKKLEYENIYSNFSEKLVQKIQWQPR